MAVSRGGDWGGVAEIDRSLLQYIHLGAWVTRDGVPLVFESEIKSYSELCLVCFLESFFFSLVTYNIGVHLIHLLASVKTLVGQYMLLLCGLVLVLLLCWGLLPHWCPWGGSGSR